VVDSVTAMAFVQQPVGSGSDVLVSYLPILMMLLVACGFAAVMLTMSRLVGQKKPTKEKLMPYECGKDPVGSARERHSVRFYMVAMIFLLFDIEAIFLVPWAVAYGNVLADPRASVSMQLLFYGEMMAFIGILFAGLIYVWKKGVFEWNR
jgi:NADH-quinone oxidoreductase subunit A